MRVKPFEFGCSNVYKHEKYTKEYLNKNPWVVYFKKKSQFDNFVKFTREFLGLDFNRYFDHQFNRVGNAYTDGTIAHSLKTGSGDPVNEDKREVLPIEFDENDNPYFTDFIEAPEVLSKNQEYLLSSIEAIEETVNKAEQKIKELLDKRESLILQFKSTVNKGW